jgi:hypothetical protein
VTRFTVGFGVMLVCAVAAMASAQNRPPATEPPGQAPPAKSGADPTDFITRYEPSIEHKSIDGGIGLDLLTLRADFALKSTASVRLDLPLVGYRPDAAMLTGGAKPGLSLGDAVLQFTVKPYSRAKLAAIAGLRIDMDMATTPEVGQGGTTYAPLGAVAFFLPHKSIFAPFVQWTLGSGLDNLPQTGTRDANRLSLRTIYLWQAGRKNVAYITIDPEYIWDFVAHEFTATVGIEYGKAVGPAQLLTLKPTFALTSGTTNWGFKVGFRHMFPGRFIL